MNKICNWMELFGRMAVVRHKCLCYVLAMSDYVQATMFEIVKRIQSDMSGVRTDVTALKTDMTGVIERMDRLETLVRKQGRDSAAMLVMMRGTVGIYDERLKMIEEDVRLIMERE